MNWVVIIDFYLSHMCIPFRWFNPANESGIDIYARLTVDGKRVDISVKRLIEDKFCNGNIGFALYVKRLSFVSGQEVDF